MKTITMNMKEIDNENGTEKNVTRGSVYTIHTIQVHINKSIGHVNQQQ